MVRIVTQDRRWLSLALWIGLAAGLLGAAAILLSRPPAGASGAAPPASPAATVAQLRYLLFLLVILILVLGVSLLAIFRWSRQFRRWILHRPAPPTPAEDVWAMHRLEDETDGPADVKGQPES